MEETRMSRRELSRLILVGLIFIGIALLLILAFRDNEELKSSQLGDVQMYVYTVGFPLLIAGLFAAFVWVLTGPRTEVKRKWWFYPLITAGLTFCGFFLAYALLGMWPIGRKSAMLVDMHHQYGPLLARLREMLMHPIKEGLGAYNFEIGMGTSFLPMAGYYLASPLNVLLVLFPASMLTEAILVITLIKNMLCGFTFALAMQYIYKRRDPSVVITGVMYALMMFCLAYSWNIMWLDGLFMLPLVLMTFEHMMRTGKYVRYALALGYTLYANYYIAFMICLFLIGYFVVFMLRHPRTLAQRRQGFLRFSVGSLLGGGIAAFMIIPVFIGLGHTSAAGAGLPDLAAKFSLYDLLGRHLFAVTPTIRARDLPNVYCGILTVVLLPIFTTLKEIPLRRRACYLVLLGFVTLSLPINQLNLMWHGFHDPNDLPYRFSFIYCFILLLIAYETLRHADKLKPGAIGGAVALLAGYLVLEDKFGSGTYDFNSLYISLLCAVVYALVLLAIARRKLFLRAGYMLLLAIVMVELTFNASWVIDSLGSREVYTEHANYVDNLTTDTVRDAVRRAQAIAVADAESNYTQGVFSRMETIPRRTTVDTALFGYAGITSFASSNLYTTTRFMGGMGYAVNGVNSYLYHSFIPVTDSLLGIRYLVMDKDLGTHPQLQYRDTTETSRQVKDSDGNVTEQTDSRYIYENPQALSVAFRVNPSVKDWSSTYYNPIKTVNSLYQSMTGVSSEVLVPQQLTVPEGDDEILRVNGVYGFTFSPSGSQTATAEVAITDPGQYVIYGDCRAAEGMRAKVRDADGVEMSGYDWSISNHEPYFIDASYLSEGMTVEVDVTAKTTASGNIYVARLNRTVYDDAMRTLAADSLRVTSFKESYIKGTIHASASGAMFTSIPFEKGWTVKVNGKKVHTYAIDGEQRVAEGTEAAKQSGLFRKQTQGDQVGALLGFDIPAGDSTVEFSFSPEGFAPGILISIVCAAALVLLGMLTGKHRERWAESHPGLAGAFPLSNTDAEWVPDVEAEVLDVDTEKLPPELPDANTGEDASLYAMPLAELLPELPELPDLPDLPGEAEPAAEPAEADPAEHEEGDA